MTNENLGSLIGEEWKKVLKLNSLYAQAKNKYDLFYKNSNIEKTMKTNKMIIVILIIILIIYLINTFKI